MQIRQSLGMVSRKEPFGLTNDEKAEALVAITPWRKRYEVWQAPKHLYLVDKAINDDGRNSIYEITDRFVIAINEPNEHKAKETVAVILRTLERVVARKKIYGKETT